MNRVARESSSEPALRRKPSRVNPITTPEELIGNLQTALEVEHSTIPPYLCALYSIRDGAIQEATNLIRSVVMEEMLHMILVANVLNAIGGKPNLKHPGFVPKYPTYLRHSNRSFVVSLEKFSRSSIATFLKIEKPQKPGAPPEPRRYATLGQFYDAIREGLKCVCAGNKNFTGKRSRQVTPDYYYGGGGGAFEVIDLESALRALKVITDQGEGVDHTISDGDRQIFRQENEYAHYFRFNEIYQQRCYKKDDTPKSGPHGPTLPIDWSAVYNMRPNPKMAYYPAGSELWVKTIEFNRTYRSLLATLHAAVNGKPKRLVEAVPLMYELKYKAVSLMKTPCDDSGMTAGPSFEYIPPRV